MNAIKRQLGLVLSSALVVAGAWACTATRHSDGSLTLKFAPDMSIRAWGLEDALEKLTDLMNNCIAGTFGRPCTPGEMAEINKAIDRIGDSKDRLMDNFASGRPV